MDNKKIISTYILQNADIEDIDYDYRIFDEGLVSSLFAIDLMTFLERKFDIKIKLEDLDMENFQTINTIFKFVNEKREVKNV